MKWFRFFVVFTVFALLMNCGGFSTENPGIRKRNQPDNPRSEERLITTEDIQDLDISELTKSIASEVKSDGGNCSDYNSGVASFSFSNFSKAFKNCMAKTIDDQLAPLCEHEDQLNNYECGRDDDACEDKLDEAKDSLEATKDQVIDQIYQIADALDETYLKASDAMPDDALVGRLIKSFADIEFGGYVLFLENKANAVCGLKLDFSKFK